MSKILFMLLIIIGIINFLPVLGLLSVGRLESAYGVEILSHDLAILMRHRALLFGLIGGFVIYSAFNPVYRSPALFLAGLSMIGFVILAHMTGEFNQNIKKIVLVDYVGIVILGVAIVIRFFHVRT